jgi:RNA polymerase sigma-70 factor (ECF subfamily)
MARKVRAGRAEDEPVTVTVPVDALVAARLGAGWAFEGIYTALGGPVRRFLAAQGAPDPDATTQEVFIKVFRSLDRFDGDAEHLRSWVFTVARNLLIDERRAAARRPVVAPAPAAERPAPGAEADLAARLDACWVREVLEGLPDEQREVVVLRFLVDLPLSDVAAVLGRSLAAVKALQHRGLAHLRRQLEDPVSEAAPFRATPSFTAV